MTSPIPLSSTPRTKPTRTRERTRSDREDLYEVLDAGLVGHLGIVLADSVHVLPTGYGREGDMLYLHGSVGAQSIRSMAAGIPVCFTVTHVDGIVYARAAFSHSMNYRSAVIHGNARLLTDPLERMSALRVLTEHLAPGSWDESRLPNKKEDVATAVLALPLAEASVKIRSGPPGDKPEDLREDRYWAGGTAYPDDLWGARTVSSPSGRESRAATRHGSSLSVGSRSCRSHAVECDAWTCAQRLMPILIG